MSMSTQNPEIVGAEQLLNAVLSAEQVIDVRSPSEFSLDHLPGAINIPVLSDEERILVGTLHKANPFEARRLGAGLVSHNIARALEGPLADRSKHWRPMVYCWRGGNRSGAMATVLARVGWRVLLVEGGYQQFRRALIQDLPQQVSRLTFQVVCGVTGSGKTRFLSALARAGQQVLDLEALAHHRGSILGADPDRAQPSQKLFETRLWQALRGLDADRTVYVESESRKVGNVQVPTELIEQMRASPCIRLELSLADRVSLLCEDYAHFFQDPDRLVTQLEKLVSLVGHERVEGWKASIAQADWSSLVRALLVEHYDPSYLRSIDRNFHQHPRARVLALGGHAPQDYDAAAASLSG